MRRILEKKAGVVPPPAHWVPLAILFLLPLLVDFPVLLGGFSFDDLHSISRNPHIRGIENIPRFFVDPSCFSGIPGNAMYRPFLLTTYAVDYAIAGLSPWFWHLTNLLLHGAAGVLLFFFLRRFLGSARRREPGSGEAGRTWSRGRTGPAFLGALFFLVHPLNVEVLGHVSSRSDLLLGVLLLGALLAGVRAVEGGRIRPGAFSLSLLLLAAALLTKEPAVLFPAAAAPFLAAAQQGEPSRARRLARAAALLLPAALLVGVYLVIRKHLLGVAAATLPSWTGGADPLHGGGRDMATQLFTQALVLGRTVLLLFFPWKLSADHWIPLQRTFFSPPVLAGLAGTLFFLGAVLRLGRPRAAAAAGLFWAALLLSPQILVPLNQLFAEHRLYCAGPGLVLALAAAAAGLRARGRLPSLSAPAGKALLAGALLLLAGRSFLRGFDWRDRETLWRATLATDPGSYRAWAQLGQVLGEKGDEEGALACFQKAHRLYRASSGIAVNLAEYLVRLGTRKKDPSLCRRALQVARDQVRRTPWKALPRVKLCRSLLALASLENRPDLARRAAEAAASILSFTKPLDRTWAVWAAALEAAGQGEAARALWEWGDRILPSQSSRARLARAGLLLRLGRPGQARKALGPLKGRSDPALREMARRIRRFSGTSPAGSSGSPGASPPGR